MSLSKLLSPCLKLDYIFHFLFFLIGLSFGIFASFYFNTFFVALRTSSLYSSSLLLSASSENAMTLNSSNLVLKSLVHDMSDVELLWTASRLPTIGELSYKFGVNKVAFMFLTKGPLPLAPLWDKFFKGHEEYYSIYVHADPFYNESYPENSAFHARRIPSQRVLWGSSSMIDAERRLLANALLDLSNKRFVLLSESCIPLFHFKSTYDYLINSNSSFVGSYDEPTTTGRGRYNPRMTPIINITNWQKGSQWFEMHRDLAVLVVSDMKYYQVFIDHCHPPCYMDEHYIPTLATMLYAELNSNRSLTWVDWSSARSAHPGKFGRQDVTDKFLNRIRNGSQCVYNGNTTSMCVLFARKFAPNTLEPLLRRFDP